MIRRSLSRSTSSMSSMSLKSLKSLMLLIAVSLVSASLLAPSLASAQYREFTGRIDVVKKKKFIVDNRQGDKVSFVFIAGTEVSGERSAVKKIKKGDWVTVSWKFVDKPRKAYKIVVLPPRKDDD